MTNKLYVCVARRDDHYVRKEGGKFDAEEFEKHPYRYASTFSQKVDLDIYIYNFDRYVFEVFKCDKNKF